MGGGGGGRKYGLWEVAGGPLCGRGCICCYLVDGKGGRGLLGALGYMYDTTFIRPLTAPPTSPLHPKMGEGVVFQVSPQPLGMNEAAPPLRSPPVPSPPTRFPFALTALPSSSPYFPCHVPLTPSLLFHLTTLAGSPSPPFSPLFLPRPVTIGNSASDSRPIIPLQLGPGNPPSLNCKYRILHTQKSVTDMAGTGRVCTYYVWWGGAGQGVHEAHAACTPPLRARWKSLLASLFVISFTTWTREKDEEEGEEVGRGKEGKMKR